MACTDCGQPPRPPCDRTAGPKRSISKHRHRLRQAKIQPVNPSPYPCLSAAPGRPRPALGAGGLAAAWRGAGLVVGGLGLAAAALAEPPPANPQRGASPAEQLATEVAAMVLQAASLIWGESARPPRIEVQVGRLDARLRLAPCQQIVPYLPAGSRPIGRTRIGLRCAEGSAHWNVSLPVTVMVWAPAVVAATALAVGTVLQPQHLAQAEVDLAARADPALQLTAAALGRTLARGLAPGEALRRDDLKTRQWFNAGDTVRVLGQGPGYAVSSEGQALNAGVDGQTVRVRTEGGRIISGVANGDHRVEVTL